MSKNCIGCGITLQCEDAFLDGYVNPTLYNETIMCKRCFRLKNYGEYKVTNKSNNYYKSIIKQIFKCNNLVLHIVDLFDMGNMEYIYSNVYSPCILVLSKIDVIPKSINEEKLISYFKNKYPKYKDVIAISSEKNYHMDELLDLIMKYKVDEDVYVLGNTNAGKSTFINKMIKDYTDKNNYIVTSYMPSTTLNVISIKLNDDITLLDTPGILNDGNVTNYFDEDIVKDVMIHHEIKPRIYQNKDIMSLVIDKIGRIDVLDECNISIYISNNIDIDSVNFKSNNKYRDIEATKVRVTSEEELVIEGLCFIKFSSKTALNIYINDGIDIYKRDKII